MLIGGTALIVVERSIKRAQRTQQAIDTIAPLGQRLLAAFHPLDNPGWLKPAIRPTKCIAPIEQLIASKFGFASDRIGECGPKLLLCLVDAQLGMQEIEPSLEPVLESIRATVEIARTSSIGQCSIGLRIGGKLLRSALCIARDRDKTNGESGHNPERQQRAAGPAAVHGDSPWEHATPDGMQFDPPNVTITHAKLLFQLKKF